jgi:hypothetical protein
LLHHDLLAPPLLLLLPLLRLLRQLQALASCCLHHWRHALKPAVYSGAMRHHHPLAMPH